MAPRRLTPDGRLAARREIVAGPPAKGAKRFAAPALIRRRKRRLQDG